MNDLPSSKDISIVVWENGKFYQPGLGTPSDPSGLSNPIMKAPTSGMFNNMTWKQKGGVIGFLAGLAVIAWLIAAWINADDQATKRQMAARQASACQQFWHDRVEFVRQGNHPAPVQQQAMRDCPNAVPRLMGQQ